MKKKNIYNLDNTKENKTIQITQIQTFLKHNRRNCNCYYKNNKKKIRIFILEKQSNKIIVYCNFRNIFLNRKSDLGLKR